MPYRPPPPQADPFATWEENSRLARRYAAALPLFMSLMREGKMSRRGADQFQAVLEETLELPLGEPGVADQILKDFARVSRHATPRQCAHWVAATLDKRGDREIPLWILVDHAMNEGEGDVSETLGLLLDAFGMSTRDFQKLMLENGDLDIVEHPRPPENEEVRRRCILTREGKYLEFVELDEE